MCSAATFERPHITTSGSPLVSIILPRGRKEALLVAETQSRVRGVRSVGTLPANADWTHSNVYQLFVFRALMACYGDNPQHPPILRIDALLGGSAGRGS